MCNVAVIEFFHEYVEPEELYKKRVLEVGSKYVNGSVRPLIERFLNPKEYIGIDIEPGKYVDILLPAEKIVEYFGEESFDVIVSTEVLEHVRDWRAVINNMKRALKEGGIMYITTRSFGFPYHNFPQDFWRYEIEDMRKIFDDFNIIVLKRDSSAPGVFLKARKPEAFKPNDLSDIALYSIILGKKTRKIPSISEMPLRRKISLELTIKISHLGRYLINKLSSKYMV